MPVAKLHSIQAVLGADATNEPVAEWRHLAEENGGSRLGASVGLRERGEHDIALGHGWRSARVYSGSSSPYALARLWALRAAHSLRSPSSSGVVGESTVTVRGAFVGSRNGSLSTMCSPS